MKALKKAFAFILAVSMIMTSLGTVSAFADGSEKTIFSDDFESYSENEPVPTQGSTADKWSGRVESATSTVRTKKVDGSMVVCMTNTDTEKNGGPRLQKNLNLTGVKNLTVNVRAKSEGTNVIIGFTGSGAMELIKENTDGKWVEYKFVFDLPNLKYTVYKNGNAALKNASMKDVSDWAGAGIALNSSVKDGNCVYYDNFSITTTDGVDISAVASGTGKSTPSSSTGTAVTPSTTKTNPPKAMSDVPSGARLLFKNDMESYTDSVLGKGSESDFTTVVNRDYLSVAQNGENKVMMGTHKKDVLTQPRVEKRIYLGGECHDLTFEFAFKCSKSEISANLASNGTTVFTTGKISERTSVSGTTIDGTDWSYLKYEVDFDKKTFSVWINGCLYKQNEPFKTDTGDYSTVNIVVYNHINPGDTTYTDNYLAYTKSNLVINTMLYGDKGVNWDMVGSELTADSYMANLKAHPRIIVNDFSEMKNKISANEECAQWYATAKSRADQLLGEAYVGYTYDNGRNILREAREIRKRLYVLSFVYNMEGDRKYLDRALGEIRNAGTFPDWCNDYAPMIPSELVIGVAVAYDWLYNDLTADEKKEIIDIMFNMAAYQFVYSYEGKINVEIARGVTNRTLLANACIINVGIAVADEYPKVAQYFFDNALKYIMPAFNEYASDGGFPEGSTYWGLATGYAVDAMCAIQSAAKSGYKIPEYARLWEHEGITNTAKYHIYLNGRNKKFNFGDASDGLESGPLLYWLAKQYNVPAYAAYSKYLHDINNTKFDAENSVKAICYYDLNMNQTLADFDLDCVFNKTDSAQVLSMRSSWYDEDAIYVAVQGGSNKTGHMFYSLGTFCLDANGKRFIRTSGMSDYNWKEAKENYYRKRTEGQNTLLANPSSGSGQNNEAVARFTKFESSDTEAFGVLDLTETNDAFKSATRAIKMANNRTSVIMQDEIEMNYPSEVYWFAHTDGDITLAPDKKSAIITIGGDRMYVALKAAPEGSTLEVMDAKPLPTSPVAKDEIYYTMYKLAVHMTDVTKATVCVEFVPLKDGEIAPSSLSEVTPIDTWTVSKKEANGAEHIGQSVALVLGSPAAYAKGAKTYVDELNLDVSPIEQNGRTLVPVRFISEKFGANVGWDAASETVSVKMGTKEITLKIGSNEMYINGEKKILDVSAQTINDRTLIPLRALVEALGKDVFWDDRGLIIISDFASSYSEKTVNDLITMLTSRVYINGEELKSFTTEKTDYAVNADSSAQIYVSSGAEVVKNGNVASFTIGSETYKIELTGDKFYGALGTDSGVQRIKVAAKGFAAVPDYSTWIDVKDVTMSTGEDKYPTTGTIDNIIGSELANRWSGNGAGAYLIYDLGEVKNIHSFGLATLNGSKRKFFFKVEVSDDNETWKEVMNTETSGTTDLFDIFSMGVSARYIKVTGYGDSNGGSYNSWTEVRFWESQAQQDEDKSYWPVYFAESDASGSAGQQLQLVTTAYDKANRTVDTAVSYKSLSPEIAEVDSNGTVTLKAPGKAVIVASATNGFRVFEAKIEVECK